MQGQTRLTQCDQGLSKSLLWSPFFRAQVRCHGLLYPRESDLSQNPRILDKQWFGVNVKKLPDCRENGNFFSGKSRGEHKEIDMVTKRVLITSTVISLFIVSCAWSAEPSKLVDACVSCHGLNGANTESDVPNIGGYSQTYLLGTLDRFKNNLRPCSETNFRTGDKKGTKTNMCQIAKDLDDKDAEKIAEYFAAQKFVVIQQKFDPALAEKGKDIFRQNCIKCHSIEGEIGNDDAGILAGQKSDYLSLQIEQFVAGTRPMMKKMKPKLDRLDKADLDAVVQYLSSFK